MEIKISGKTVNSKVGKVADEIVILIRKNQYQCSDDDLRSMIYDVIIKNLKKQKNENKNTCSLLSGGV